MCTHPLVKNMVKADSSDDITLLHCSIVHRLCSLHQWTHKHALPGVMNGLCTAIQLWYPTLWSSWQTVSYENGFSCRKLKFTVNRSAVACLLCLALKINARLSWSWSMRFRPLLPFADDVFPSEFHADTTLATVVHETSANWAVCHWSSGQMRTNNHAHFSHWCLLLQPCEP